MRQILLEKNSKEHIYRFREHFAIFITKGPNDYEETIYIEQMDYRLLTDNSVIVATEFDFYSRELNKWYLCTKHSKFSIWRLILDTKMRYNVEGKTGLHFFTPIHNNVLVCVSY